MEIQEQKAHERKDGEEDLLNFDLDDLSLEEVDQMATGDEEEIIELTDLVEKGAVPDQEGQDEIARLLEEEAGAGTAEIALGTEELAGLNGILKERKKEKVESELDMSELSLDFPAEEQAAVEEKVLEEEISETDLAQILKEEGAETLDLGAEEVVVAEEKVLEEAISEAELAAIAEGEPVEEPAAMPTQEHAEPKELVLDLLEEEAVEPEPMAPPVVEKPQAVLDVPALAPMETEPVRVTAVEPPVQAPVEISEEKLEAIVTKVVQDVVERVTREVLERVAERVARDTMVEVAERVIAQAIDALKQSLETPSD